MPTRLVYVTVHYPTAPGEEFLAAEASALGARFKDMLVVPLRPRMSVAEKVVVRPLLDRRIAAAALRVIGRHPILVSRVTLRAVPGPGIRSALKRLSVVPKALWLSTLVDRDSHIHAAWGSAPATAALVAATISGATFSFSVHRHDIARRHALPAKAGQALFVRAISETAKRRLLSFLPAQLHNRVHVVHLGIDVPVPTPAARTRGRLVVVSPGALTPRKNQATLLRAVARYDDERVELLLAGDGPDRAALMALGAELGITDQVSFLGHVPHSELLAMYRSRPPAIATLASLDEGLPIALVEALAAGIPVAAARVGAIEELLWPAVGVIVDDPFDVEAFVEAWRTIRSWDPEVTAARAYRVAREGFSVEVTVPQLIALMRLAPSRS